VLAHQGLVEASDLFEKDHGIGAILPYVRHFFPDVTIVPIAVGLASQKRIVGPIGVGARRA
jgi:poly-gamma-glutamate synthesis protein (capsule biosynthesis protein)